MRELRVVVATLAAVAILIAAMPEVWAGTTTAKVLVKEDVSVRSSAPNTNYATSMALYAGTASTAVYRSYLKFDLSALPEGTTVTRATLTVWSRRVAADATRVAVFPAGDGWSEKALTWSNTPALGDSALDTDVLPLSSGPAANTWDVSAYTAAEAEGDGVATHVLAESAPPQGTWAWFADSLDSTVPKPSLDLELEEAAPKDVTAPTISLDLLQTSLWPPNHKMIHCATVSVSDDLDTAPSVTVAVANSEADGSGSADPDVEVKAAGDLKWEVWLRSERTGNGEGREYKISVGAKDAAGNESAQDGAVLVPHDQGKGKP